MSATGHGADADKAIATPPSERAQAGRLGSTRERRTLPSELSMFLMVGIASTFAYGLLYLLLRQALGAQLANGLALFATAIANTAANRRLTFGIRDRSRMVQQHAECLGIFGAGLILTSGSLWVLGLVDTDSARVHEIAVLTVANLTVTVVRFVAMRAHIFRRQPT